MKIEKIIFGSGIIVMLGLSAVSCGKKGEASQPVETSVQVVPYTVHSENVVFYDAYPATLTALNEIQLRSEVNGYVTGIFFREGGHVNKGDKLYEIDRRKYQAAYDAARANVEIANSNLQKAVRDAERYKKLDDQNAIAKQVLDDGMTALENAKMQLQLANANLLSAETDYKYSLMTAPFSGLIGFSSVKPGAFVSAGQTLLTSISSDDPIGADFFLDQKSLSYFLKIEKDRIAASDSVFKIILPDNSGYNHYGKLGVVDRAADPLTGTIKIRIIFPNPDNRLRPGMDCKLQVLDKDSGKQIVIPAKAAVEQMSENQVYVIENGRISQRLVKLGANVGKNVIVLQGLKEGETIVLDGIQGVREGTLVTMLPAEKSSNTAVPVATTGK